MGIAMIFSTSCSNEETKTENKHEEHVENHQEDKKETCLYSVDKESLRINWTAFKHTAKAPVGGVFDMVELNHVTPAEKISDVFKNATVSIYTHSVNSNNEGRDEKIKTSFFDTMEKTTIITGAIKSIEGGEDDGTAVISITMNDVEKDIDFDWKTMEDRTGLLLKGEINVGDFNATPSLDALHEVCAEKHTGEDGKSVLWPEVQINIKVALNKECK